MGLIYVNPEGPNGNPDPLAAARDIRETFRRMAMNDEETVALIVGGHTFGKTHGAGDPTSSAPSPRAARSSTGPRLEEQLRHRQGQDTITSGLEGAWTPTPTTWDNSFLETLFGYEWELTESPAGAKQWKPKDGAAADAVPDAHDPSVRHAPMMLTTDLALRVDPIYEPISRRFLEHPDELADAFAKAWYKLLHRDMGPVSRYLGPWVPEPQLWQDPVPAVDHELIDERRHRRAQGARSSTPGCPSRSSSPPRGRRRRPSAAPTSAAAPTARGIRLAPQKDWEVNEPAELATVLPTLEQIQQDFNAAQSGGKKVSLADLIVLGGCAAVEQAAKDAGHDVTVPFAPGRTDATQEQTDVESFAVLEPQADGFRNYLRRRREAAAGDAAARPGQPADADRARDDGARRRPAGARRQRGGPEHGVLHRPARHADQRLLRQPARHGHRVEAVGRGRERLRGPRPGHRRRASGPPRRVDLVFGSNSQLRAHRRGLRRATTPRRSSSTTSWPPGSRS